MNHFCVEGFTLVVLFGSLRFCVCVPVCAFVRVCVCVLVFVCVYAYS